MTATTNTTKQAVPDGYWEDAKGSLIPVGRIQDVDKLRDRTVKALMKEAKEHSGLLTDFRARALGAFDGFCEQSADVYKAPLRGMKDSTTRKAKGNVTLFSFDGRYKVQRSTADKIQFDERLHTAKELIMACVQSWQKGANKNLQAIVSRAFDTDKEGNLSVGRVLSLRSLKIENDERWDAAMVALAEGMKAVGSKTYLRFYERDDANGEYRPVSLDIASV